MALCSLCFSLVHWIIWALIFVCLFVQNGNVCCSVDLECLHNNWSNTVELFYVRKTDTVNIWNEVVWVGVLYNRQLPKSPHEEDVWELPLGPTTMLILASLVWVTLQYNTLISLWLLKAFSVVNNTLLPVRLFANMFISWVN